MSDALTDDDVVAMAERVNAGTIDVGAQIEKFGKDALATIDRLQSEKRELLKALRRAANELEQYVDLQQKLGYVEYAASTQKELDAVNATITKVTHVQ